ncbi:MAG: bacillithiol system redox-active protein YtxJ [Flavobacteriales bacterium]|nr:bacillithiol system redox-active protein YtxJ [Flavobacteriales bacterium]
MDWNNLNSVEQLSEIDEKSKTKTQIIFKHSTRCSVSSFAKRILTSEFNEDIQNKVDVHYLDLIAFREISQEIASRYSVLHESPQILVINNGVCSYNASHSDVSFDKALNK